MNALNGGKGGVFLDNPRGPLTRTDVRVFTWKWELRDRLAGVITYQFGIDLIVFGVMGYAIRLLVG
jgi:hypothetical protein